MPATASLGKSPPVFWFHFASKLAWVNHAQSLLTLQQLHLQHRRPLPTRVGDNDTHTPRAPPCAPPKPINTPKRIENARRKGLTRRYHKSTITVVDRDQNVFVGNPRRIVALVGECKLGARIFRSKIRQNESTPTRCRFMALVHSSDTEHRSCERMCKHATGGHGERKIPSK
jgi:hypothetical protein